MPQTNENAIRKGLEAIAAGIIIASIIFGFFFYNSRLGKGELNIIGKAKQTYSADVIKWQMAISRRGDLKNPKAGYLLLESDLATLQALLRESGIKPEEITVKPINTTEERDRDGNIVAYNLEVTVYTISKDIDKVEKLALNPKTLFEKGIVVKNSETSYFFADLTEIKKDLLAKATKDAIGRGAEIAKNAGVKLDKMMSARSGVFSITEPYSNENNDYGSYNTSTRKKDISITMYVTFRLK